MQPKDVFLGRTQATASQHDVSASKKGARDAAA